MHRLCAILFLASLSYAASTLAATDDDFVYLEPQLLDVSDTNNEDSSPAFCDETSSPAQCWMSQCHLDTEGTTWCTHQEIDCTSKDIPQPCATFEKQPLEERRPKITTDRDPLPDRWHSGGIEGSGAYGGPWEHSSHWSTRRDWYSSDLH